MNARLRAVVGHAVGWCIVVAFVVLLTLIFNFLGTIICAALAGMMMGSARISRGPCLLASLIFPAVIATVLRISHAELANKQILMLALVCFGVFWAICAVMHTLVSPATTSNPSLVAQQGGGNCPGATDAAPTGSPAAKSAASAPKLSDLKLELLQGIWLSKPAEGDEPSQRRVLEIQDETLLLKVLDARGEASSTAKARLRLNANRFESTRPSSPHDAQVLEFII